MSTSRAQIFVFKYHSQIKGTRAPWRSVSFQDGGRKHSRGSWSILSKSKKMLEKGTGANLKQLPMAKAGII